MRRHHAVTTTAIGAGIALSSVLALGACSAAGHDDDSVVSSSAHAATDTSTSAPQPTVTATPTLSPAVRRAESTFDAANRALAAKDSAAGDHEIVAALVAAGFSKSAMEITPDSTTIGRRADSVEVSVLVDGMCLIGGFNGGSYAGATAPVLSTGKCLIGNTQSIDW